MQLQRCTSVPMRYQSHDEFFAICAILTVRGLACSEHCLKVTNLSCIAVFSIHQSLTSSHRTYKIAVWFIWKILPYLSCRFDHITKGERMIASCQHCCVCQKWKFNVFVTMGRVFHFASHWSRDRFFCVLCTTYLPIAIGNKFYKNTFSLFRYCELTPCEKRPNAKSRTRWKIFTIQTCLAITCLMCSAREMFQYRLEAVVQSKNAHFSSPLPIAEVVDRSMMDWKIVAVEYALGCCNYWILQMTRWPTMQQSWKLLMKSFIFSCWSQPGDEVFFHNKFKLFVTI